LHKSSNNKPFNNEGEQTPRTIKRNNKVFFS